MNLVDSLLETVFFGGEEGGLEDQPRPRFQWKPPGGAAPGGDDLIPGDLGDFEDAAIPPRGSITNVPRLRPPSAVPPPPSNPDELDDRTGKYSMGDLMPQGEVATSDDLLDFFSKMKAAKGKSKKSMKREFDAHSTEFESLIQQFVDGLLTEAVCDMCGHEVGDRWFADRGASGKKIAVCGNCYMKHGDQDERNPGHSFYHDEGDPTDPEDYTQAGAPAWERSRLSTKQVRRQHQSEPPLTGI
jgi:hypothetical protein